MLNKKGNIDYNHYDERSLLPMPQLVLLLMAFFSLLIALSILFLPWYMAFVLIIGFAVLIAIFFNPYIGVLVFIAGAYLHPTAFLPSNFLQLHLARNLAVVVLLMWAFHVLVYRDFYFTKSTQNYFIIGYALFLFLSCFKYYDYSFPQYIEQAVKFLILYFIIINLIKTPQECVGIAWTIVILATIAAFIGIYQYVFGVGQIYYEGRIRIVGTETDPNLFGAQLVLSVPIAMSLFWSYKNKLVRLLLIAIMFIALVAIIFTFSRTAFVALLAVIILAVVRPIFIKPRNFAPLILFIVVCLILLPFVPREYWERAKSITDLDDIAIKSRLTAWQLGWQMIKENPFRGVGFGAFKYEHLKGSLASPDVEGGYQTTLYAHNSFIEVTAEAGIFALTFLLLLILWTYRNLKHAQRIFYEKGRQMLFNISIGFEISMIGYLVGALFLSYLHLLIFWIIIPMGVVLYRVSEKVHEEN
jgi:probable O-glycosylation ligase (exosortase A-associated)